MQLANEEAQHFYHEYIGTEHILLGLVIEETGVAANVLKNLDIDVAKIRGEVEKMIQAGPPVPGGRTNCPRPPEPRRSSIMPSSRPETSSTITWARNTCCWASFGKQKGSRARF